MEKHVPINTETISRNEIAKLQKQVATLTKQLEQIKKALAIEEESTSIEAKISKPKKGQGKT